MTNHEAVHKLNDAVKHLRLADAMCGNSGVIDEIRKALFLILDVGEELGKELTTKEK